MSTWRPLLQWRKIRGSVPILTQAANGIASRALEQTRPISTGGSAHNGESSLRRGLMRLSSRTATSVDESLLLDCLTIETVPARRDGNISDIELLYRQHGSALLLFALTITGERGRAQDAIHHAFLSLIEKGSLSRAADKKAYLFACVRNAALNEGRLRERTAPLDSDSAWFDPPGRDYVGERNLRRALGNLPRISEKLWFSTYGVNSPFRTLVNCSALARIR